MGRKEFNGLALITSEVLSIEALQKLFDNKTAQDIYDWFRNHGKGAYKAFKSYVQTRITKNTGRYVIIFSYTDGINKADISRFKSKLHRSIPEFHVIERPWAEDKEGMEKYLKELR